MNPNLKGILLISTGTILWGACGVLSQYLFNTHGFQPIWLVTIRLLFAGTLLLGVDYLLYRENIFKIFFTKDWKPLVIFAIFGMLAIQYTFFMTIYTSNAATATILQYLMPIVILSYVSLSLKRLPSKIEFLSVILAMIGTFILVTKGELTHLNLSLQALFWGLASAGFAAFYTLQPRKIILRWRATLIIGWGMLIGGAILAYFEPLTTFHGIMDTKAIICLIILIIFGTAMSFYTYLESTKYLNPTQLSVFSALEPLSSIIISMLLLGSFFGMSEIIGILIIIISIVMLSKKQ